MHAPWACAGELPATRSHELIIATLNIAVGARHAQPACSDLDTVTPLYQNNGSKPEGGGGVDDGRATVF
jgi:hypothetical protein